MGDGDKGRRRFIFASVYTIDKELINDDGPTGETAS